LDDRGPYLGWHDPSVPEQQKRIIPRSPQRLASKITTKSLAKKMGFFQDFLIK
jgi:hypothetical protein